VARSSGRARDSLGRSSQRKAEGLARTADRAWPTGHDRSDTFVREGIRSRIRVARDSLHPAERRVLEIVLEQPKRILQLPIAELALLADVSEGTVIRFCYAVGCKGYQALKLALAADLAQPTLVLQEDITLADAADPMVVAQKVFASDMLALQDTLKLIDSRTFARSVKAIEEASELALFAVGSSQAVAADAAGRFLRIGHRAQAPQDAHTQLVIASLLPSSAVAIAISHSGASTETVECMALAKRRRATTIAVTASHPSPLTAHADIVLLTKSSETRYREEALASRIAQLSLLDSIYVAVAIRRPEGSLEALKATSEALESHRVH
jgi:RpiR family carbohydrate utilization transcriptional regulator